MGTMWHRGVLDNVWQIRCGRNTGTCFAVNIDGVLAVVTAKHVLPHSHLPIHFRSARGWHRLRGDVRRHAERDVAVIINPEGHPPTREDDVRNGNIQSGGYALGQTAGFAGFPLPSVLPYDIRGDGRWIPPYIRQGVISSMDPELVIDAQALPGFSGGPVVVHGLTTGQVHIIGIVRAVYTEATFFTVAEPIQHAMDLVRQRDTR